MEVINEMVQGPIDGSMFRIRLDGVSR